MRSLGFKKEVIGEEKLMFDIHARSNNEGDFNICKLERNLPYCKLIR